MEALMLGRGPHIHSYARILVADVTFGGSYSLMTMAGSTAAARLNVVILPKCRDHYTWVLLLLSFHLSLSS